MEDGEEAWVGEMYRAVAVRWVVVGGWMNERE